MPLELGVLVVDGEGRGCAHPEAAAALPPPLASHPRKHLTAIRLWKQVARERGHKAPT